MTLSLIAPPKTPLQSGHSLLAGGQKGVSVSPFHGLETLASQDAMNVWASHSRRQERSRVPKWVQKDCQKGSQKGSQKGFFQRFLVFCA